MKGRLFGATMLVTGCCIGAGMLGLPVVSSSAGFLPSTILFFFVWLFMLATGLLVLEVNLWFQEEVSFLTMAEKTLGPVGKTIAGFLFLFLFYCLMIAFIAGGGELLNDFFGISPVTGSVLLTAILGVAVATSTAAVDKMNQLFMLGLVGSFVLLVGMGLPHVQLERLAYQNWSMAYVAIPVMVISFGFHNLVPTLVDYLEHDRKKIRTAIVAGSAIPLLVYLLWDGLIMGLVSAADLAQAVGNGNMATRALKMATDQSIVLQLTQGFAFFALVTTFLGVAISLVDFLADGLHLHHRRISMTFLALLPPLIAVIVYDDIFLWILGVAGGLSAVILFGILPVLMAWSGRYYQGKADGFGGKPLLVVVFGVASAIVLSQLRGML